MLFYFLNYIVEPQKKSIRYQTGGSVFSFNKWLKVLHLTSQIFSFLIYEIALITKVTQRIILGTKFFKCSV